MLEPRRSPRAAFIYFTLPMDKEQVAKNLFGHKIYADLICAGTVRHNGDCDEVTCDIDVSPVFMVSLRDLERCATLAKLQCMLMAAGESEAYYSDTAGEAYMLLGENSFSLEQSQYLGYMQRTTLPPKMENYPIILSVLRNIGYQYTYFIPTTKLVPGAQ
tara:strand:- start:243 stop:722 length:480 start_codon:yes stop_codon:yes gene_type:complete